MHEIFISYRRADVLVMCDRIHSFLAAVFGGRAVFRDIESLRAGVDYRTELAAAMRGCKVALVLVGTSWLTVADDAGQRRLDQPNDPVRLEIETLLSQRIPVIPLLIEGAQLPLERELPPSIAELAYRQARAVRVEPDFGHDMQTVVRDITPYVPLVPPGVVVRQRIRNTLARSAGFAFSALCFVLLVNAVLNLFNLGLDVPGLTTILHHLFGQ
jgi:hypothetical protein